MEEVKEVFMLLRETCVVTKRFLLLSLCELIENMILF